MLQQKVTETVDVVQVKTVPVVAANVDLKMGTRLDNVMLKVVEWPEESVPEGTFSSVDQLVGDTAPIVLKTIKKGEAILPYKISPHGARGGLPSKIPEDMRAITIAVNEVSGVAGFVLPGDYVDILHTTSIGRRDGKPVARVLLQNVQVLGVDQISSEDETKPKVVNAATLLVTTRDGQKLALASEVGQLSMLLRNEYDASILEAKTVDLNDLVPTDKPTTVKVYKRVRRPIVEIIRGLDIKRESVTEGKPLPQTDSTETR
jgi:pilus assembly protein CpaB